jgi:hypothetical protein
MNILFILPLKQTDQLFVLALPFVLTNGKDLAKKYCRALGPVCGKRKTNTH